MKMFVGRDYQGQAIRVTKVTQLSFKVFDEAGNLLHKQTIRAGAGKHFKLDKIDAQLDSIADWIENKWPQYEFKLVPIGRSKYNFVWISDIPSNVSVLGGKTYDVHRIQLLHQPLNRSKQYIEYECLDCFKKVRVSTNPKEV